MGGATTSSRHEMPCSFGAGPCTPLPEDPRAPSCFTCSSRPSGLDRSPGRASGGCGAGSRRSSSVCGRGRPSELPSEFNDHADQQDRHAEQGSRMSRLLVALALRWLSRCRCFTLRLAPSGSRGRSPRRPTCNSARASPSRNCSAIWPWPAQVRCTARRRIAGELSSADCSGPDRLADAPTRSSPRSPIASRFCYVPDAGWHAPLTTTWRTRRRHRR